MRMARTATATGGTVRHMYVDGQRAEGRGEWDEWMCSMDGWTVMGGDGAQMRADAERWRWRRCLGDDDDNKNIETTTRISSDDDVFFLQAANGVKTSDLSGPITIN